MTTRLCNEVLCKCFHHRLVHCLEHEINKEAIDLILKLEHPKTAVDSSGNSLLHIAVMHDNVRIAQYLSQHEWDVNALNGNKMTPLMIALVEGFVDIVDVLVEKDVDLFGENESSPDMMMFVTSRLICSLNPEPKLTIGKCLEMVKMVFNKVHEQFIENTEKIGRLILNMKPHIKSCFLAFGSKELVNFILESNFDINHRATSMGCTALFYAVYYGSVDNAKLLIERGANVNIENNLGDFPLRLYLRYMVTVDKDYHVLRGLLNGCSLQVYKPDMYGKKVIESLLEVGNEELVRTVLRRRLNLTAALGDGRHIAHVLTCNNDPNVLNLLTEFKIPFDPNIRDEVGNTLLMLATSMGHEKKIDFLLDHGADVNAQNSRGLTALTFVLRNDKNLNLLYANGPQIRENIITKLLHHHAEVQITYPDGSTILDDLASATEHRSLKPVLAHLAMLDSSDRDLLSESTFSEIEQHVFLKERFDYCKQQLHEMRYIFVSQEEQISLFSLLMDNEENFLCVSSKPNFLHNYTRALQRIPCLEDYYKLMLDKRIRNIVTLAEALKSLRNLCKLESLPFT